MSNVRFHVLQRPRLSRIGLFFAGIYLVAVIACLLLALSSGADFKGRFVYLQLPLVLQASLLQSIGLSPIVSELSWVAGYLLIGLPTMALLYWAGWLVDRLRASQARLVEELRAK